MQNAFDFYLPTRLCFGSGARRRLPEQLTRLGVRNLLLCTDKMLRSAGVVEKITSILDGCPDVRYTIYDDVTENPGNSVVDNGYALARELSAEARVIVCTTTHIYPPDGLPILWSPDREVLQDAFHEGNTLCVSSGMERGKLLPPGTPFSVLTSCADFVLTEADGSHGLPAKAHAPHEPVIPPEAGQTICVFGLSALGRPILETVHRPQLCAQKLGVSESALLTPELAAQLLRLEGGFTRVLLNQADTPERAQLGENMAAMLGCPVCIGSLQRGILKCLY